MLLLFPTLLSAHNVETLKAWTDRHQGNLETRGYNRGEIIDVWNRRVNAPPGSPYCASGTSSALDENFVTKPTIRTAWARSFSKCEGVDASAVWKGKAEIPFPCVVAFVRKSGGHAGIGFSRAGDRVRIWEPNTSPDGSTASQWNGVFTGYRNRSIKTTCSPWNAFRIVKFGYIEFASLPTHGGQGIPFSGSSPLGYLRLRMNEYLKTTFLPVSGAITAFLGLTPTENPDGRYIPLYKPTT